VSIKLVARVWELALPRPEQLVLLAVADHARDDGTKVYPSIAHLAWKTGYSDRQVQRAMSSLRRRGVLAIVSPGGGERATEYRLHLEVLAEKPPYRSPAGDAMSPVTPTSPPGDTYVTGDTRVTPTVIRSSTSPVVRFEGQSFQVLPERLEYWQGVYIAVDVAAEVRAAHAWLLANPARRPRNPERFLVGWLKRAQDQARPRRETFEERQQRYLKVLQGGSA